MKRAPGAKLQSLGQQTGRQLREWKPGLKKKKPTEVKIQLQEVQKMSSVENTAKTWIRGTRELQPHKSEMDHLKCLEIRWETEKIGIEIFKTHIIRTLAAGKYTGTEQLLKDLFKKLELEEDVNPYSGRPQHVSWKADPECSVVGGSVTQPLYPGDGVRGAGWRKRGKKWSDVLVNTCWISC